MLDPEILEALRDPQSEEQTAGIIRRYLLQASHKAQLAALDLTVEDVLNGRFPCDKLPDIQQMLTDWNTRCGEDLFAF